MPATEFSQRRADASLRVSEVGTIAMPVIVMGAALRVPFAAVVIAYLILIGSIIFLYRNRMQDEFLHKHWNAGATAGFFAIFVWSILAPFLIGIWDGVQGNPKGATQAYKIMALGVTPIALGSFFLAFQINRWRNR